MTLSHWMRPHSFKVPDVTTDVLIIGGGYAGLSTAYWLSEMRSDLKITILEKSSVGNGASGRNAGFLTKGSASFYKSLNKTWGTNRALEIFQFAEESVNLAYLHILQSSPEMKFEHTSSLTLFQNEALKASWDDDAFNPELFKFGWKNPALLPPQLSSRFVGAFENSPEYKINPIQLLSSLRKKLESRKVQIIENVSGYQISTDGVQTEVNTIKCKQVVLALNGYFPEFHASFKDVIIPHRAQMLAVELEESLDCPSLHYDPPERVYWRKQDEKILLIGGKRLLDERGEVGNYEKLSSIIQTGLESYLQEQLKLKFKIIHRWSGIMGFTEHELPIISKVEAPLETFVIGGFSGHGMGLGFRSGMDMAELVLGKRENSFFSSFKKYKLAL